MIQGIIVVILIVLVIWLAISNALLKIKNDVVTAELNVKNEGDALIKIMRKWRDEDDRLNNCINRYDSNNSNAADVNAKAMADNTKAE